MGKGGSEGKGRPSGQKSSFLKISWGAQNQVDSHLVKERATLSRDSSSQKKSTLKGKDLEKGGKKRKKKSSSREKKHHESVGEKGYRAGTNAP